MTTEMIVTLRYQLSNNLDTFISHLQELHPHQPPHHIVVAILDKRLKCVKKQVTMEMDLAMVASTKPVSGVRGNPWLNCPPPAKIHIVPGTDPRAQSLMFTSFTFGAIFPFYLTGDTDG